MLNLINSRIQNGEFSERALAKRIGVSQPQLHNVLKGARSLRPPLADALLTNIGISLFDLLTAAEKTELPLLEISSNVLAGPRPLVVILGSSLPESGIPRKGPNSAQKPHTPARKIG